MEQRRRVVIAAAAGLAIALMFVAISGRSGCVTNIKHQIGKLFEDLARSEECEDGRDNDEDGYIDSTGSDDWPADVKCQALNTSGESPNLNLSSSATVGREGGLLASGNLHLYIPEGALTQNTEITIERIPGVSADILSNADVYELKPDGLTFLEPVALVFYLQRNDGDLTENPWLFTEVGGNPVFLNSISSTETEDHIILFGAIDHFSKFGSRDFEEFRRRNNARDDLSHTCFPSSSFIDCPLQQDLCHAGLGGNRSCLYCLPASNGRFCCVCPDGYDSDYPCEDMGVDPNSFFQESPSSSCKRHKVSVRGSCEGIKNQFFLDTDGQRYAGRTFAWTEYRSSRPVVSGVHPRGNQVCGVPVLSNFVIDLKVKVFYLDWTNPGSCRSEWGRFLSELEKHEAGHGLIAQEEADRFKAEVEALSWSEICASSESELENKARFVMRKSIEEKKIESEKRWKKRKSGYDNETNHGINTGAVLNCGGCQ